MKPALVLVMCLVAGAGACRSGTPAATVAIAGRTNANPSLAALDDVVAVTWSSAGDSTMDIQSAVSTDGGRTFASPVRVNDLAGGAKVSSEQPPRVVLVPRAGATTPDLVVVWTAKSAQGTRILFARSTDGGKSFAASDTVPGSVSTGNRGWESAAVDSAGRVSILWLDHREVGSSMAMHHHVDAPAPSVDPTERASMSRLYFTSLDRTEPVVVTGGVCYCCKTSLIAAGGNLYGAWRHVYAGSQRDIAFTISHDGGRTFSAPVRVSDDGWKIDGCPENGPALAAGKDGRVHIVWPTPPDGKLDTPLALFYSSSADGASFAPRTRIPSRGPVAHAQIVIGADGVPLIAWDEIVNGRRQIAAARVPASGVPRSVELPDQAPDRGWPVLAAASGGTVAAWVQGTGVNSRIAIAPIR